MKNDGGKLVKMRPQKNGRVFSVLVFYRVVLSLVAIVCLFGVAIVLLNEYYSNKVYPNVRVSGVEVGGKNTQGIKKALADKVNNGEKQDLVFSYQDKQWDVGTEGLKLSYDITAISAKSLEVGRGEDYLRRLWGLTKAIFKAREIDPVFTYGQKHVEQMVEKINIDLGVADVDATAEIKDGKVTIIPEKNGKAVNVDKLHNDILLALENFDNHEVDVTIADVVPKVTINETDIAVEEANTMLKNQITLKYRSNSWNITQQRISGWIEFNTVETGLTVSPSVDVGEYGVDNTNKSKTYRLAASLSKKKVEKYIQKIASGIDKPAKNAKVRIVNDRPVLDGNGEVGNEVDRDQAYNEIKLAVDAGEDRDITLVVKEVNPEVTKENIAQIGIVEKIGQASTLFYGSSAVRLHNIRNGVNILNGQLIRPGVVFSEGDALGDVSAATGYLPGLIIKDNRTTPEYGGGLCQVSTTLFRTALDTGLKILERQNHSYRVSFYETDSNGRVIGPGLDSTVYFPHPDLKFLNDTGHYILITGEVVGYKATFTFWGTKDGRKVKIDGPTLLSTRPAPPTQYIKTNTLYVGQRVQRETAHAGGTAVAYYTVTRAGKTLFKQTFRSVYKPWAAVYMVGTKERKKK